MASFNLNDLQFILNQITLSEQHATREGVDGSPVAGTPLNQLISHPLLPYGVRTVDGSFNNIIEGRDTWGAADQPFPRLLDPQYRNLEPDQNDASQGDVLVPPFGPPLTNNNYDLPGNVVDSTPRTISNLIVDQTPGNPAAVMAALAFVGVEDASAAAAAISAAYIPLAAADAALRADPEDAVLQLEAQTQFTAFQAFLDANYGIEVTQERSLVIPNVAPDDGISAPFNSWFTLFGQFFDHGLDLVPKGGNGSVFIPLQPDDPLYVEGGQTNFMMVTRTVPDAINITTPFVDQNQTYTSHASHQVFLREYTIDADGDIVATGRLLTNRSANGSGEYFGAGSQDLGGLTTWAVVKAQASELLGIELTDLDVGNVPMLATDEYGRFLRGPNGFAQVWVQTGTDPDGNPITTLVEGVAGGLDLTDTVALGGTVVRTGHAFLDDIAHNAVPVVAAGQLVPDADGDAGNAVAFDPLTGRNTEYDNELLDAHFITGDGRGNENIGLSAVHHVFHSEHNRLVEHTKQVILSSNDPDFIAQWQLPDGSWNGERLFQAARFGTEMQYQHLVFEEFARKVQPAVDLFVFNPTMDINPAIVAEFAHTVYRFGHSMLNETVDRINADNSSNDIGLIDAFLNPLAFHDGGTAGPLTSEEAAGAIVRGMTQQRGNEIDEFVTDALRNNLLGLPLDLATVNLARGREAGVPSLNEARRDFYEQSNFNEWLKPYTSWIDFAKNIKHPESIINFIAAYGTHASITGETTIEGKRDAAALLVLGGAGAPADRDDFLNATGAYADKLGGLDNVDLWIGGLAEKIHPFGGMLGSTFNFVFEVQMEKLQNGDRFYYLSRTQGTHFLTELENNSFSKLVQLNTSLGDENAPHIPGELFANVDYILEVDQDRQLISDPVQDNPTLEALFPKVDRGTETFAGQTYNKLEFTGGEHVVLGGTDPAVGIPNDGRDMLIADDGDDTLWGDGGDDYLVGGHGINRLHGGDGDDIIFDGNDPSFVHGDDGDDVISAGGGIGELVFGGAGSDFITAGFDATEVFAGEGNDFILGTPDVDFLLGGEGDDWIEAGEGFDTTAGDNSELFFNSGIIGHDVMFAGSNEHDFDAESGDDIMVQGESVMRNEGMLGFDWVIFKGADIDANADMRVKIFTTVEADILRNRFDRVEAMSGWERNDILIGDDRVAPDGVFLPGVPANEATLEGDELNAEGVERIAGLNELLGISQAELDAMTPSDVVFAGGNILLGGGGNDIITGGGGNDIIDGDKWLNVRILVTPRPDQSFEAFSVDSMRDIQERMFSGEIKPSQLSIVREVVDGGQTGDIDTARFGDDRANYTITQNLDGSVTVTHDILTPGIVDPITGAVIVNEGTDTLWNIERLEFADQTVVFGVIDNVEPVGQPLINGTFQVGQTLSLALNLDGSLAGVTDADNPAGGAIFPPFTVRWQFQGEPGVGAFEDLGVTTLTFTPGTIVAGPDGAPEIIDLAGAALRVVVTYRDAEGILHSVSSDATPPLIPPFNLTATEGDDILVGTPGPDVIDALGGNDQIFGLAGNDTITGGTGDDIIDGGAGNLDRAIFVGNRDDFEFAITPEGDLEVVNLVTGEEDIVIGIERFQFDDATLTLNQVLNTIPTPATEGPDLIEGTPAADTISALGGDDTVNGGAGADDIDGGAGADTLNGEGGADRLVGGLDNDIINGDGGADVIIWNDGDGTDTVNGGAGADRLRVRGGAADEAFFVSTVADFTARTGVALASIPAGTEIILSRSVDGGPETVMVYARGIDEIDVNGGGGNDVFTVSGDFAGTDLDPSTITFTGTNGDDTIDLTGINSAHRVVIQSNGGSDTVIGTLRTQDVIQVAEGEDPTAYSITDNGNGTKTLTGPSGTVTFASNGNPVVAAFQPIPVGDTSGPPAPGSFELTSDDVAALQALVRGQQPVGFGDDEIPTGVRTLSGQGNNLANPGSGAVDQPFIRLTDAHYGEADAFGNRAINPIFDGLDPRTISNILGTQEAGLQPNAAGSNIFFMAFGQYVDHGLDFLPKGGNGTIAIGGPGTSATSDNPADLTRGTVAGYDGAVPQHNNNTSPFVDQNQAYGSNELVGQFLRESDGNGGYGARLLSGEPDPSNPAFNLLPTLRELIQHHWEHNTVFTSSSLPNGQVAFRDAFANFVDNTTGEVVASLDALKAMTGNFLGSGHALLLDTNPGINLLDHYVAGDGRANENYALTSIHTIWARNHNFHVENLLDAGFQGSAEELYQAAKIVNEAEYQRVVFGEFADALLGGIRGSGSHGHDDYNPDETAAISHEFAAAAYRFGHSLISQTITVADADGNLHEYSLVDVFLNPTNDPGSFNGPLPPGYVPQPGYAQHGVNGIVSGTVQQQAEEVDFNIVDAVRNDLVRIRADLFAFNVARGWDVGLGTLNQVRADLKASSNPYVAFAVGEAGNLDPYTSWEDFQERNGLSNAVIEQFKLAYPDLEIAADDIAAFQAANPTIELINGNTVKGIDRVDLWVGGLAEKHINDGQVGQTFWVILHEQFDRLQEADRFYYTDRLDNFDLYENFIDGQDFSDIIARNTGIEGLDEHVFGTHPLSDNPNYAPTSANVVLTASPEDADRIITVAELLSSADDADGDVLSVVDLQLAPGSSGILIANGNATWTYKPAADDDTSAVFTFKVSDGTALSSTVTATLDLLPVEETSGGGGGSGETAGSTIVGTFRRDVLTGTGGNDLMFGKDGNDKLAGHSGRDVAYGGHGHDVFVSTDGDGSDHYWGGLGRDTLTLAHITQDAIVNLTTRKASIGGVIDTFSSIENVSGGRGDDLLIGNKGANRIFGNDGDDTIAGGAGQDTLNGGSGNDILLGGGGKDKLTGGLGFDKFVFSKGFGNDVITDFDANPLNGQDKIDISAMGISALNFDTRVSIDDVGADTLVIIDQTQKILLKGVGNAGAVTESDFVLFTN